MTRTREGTDRRTTGVGDWIRVWAGAALLTLAVFLILPFTQMASSRVQRLRLLTAVQTVNLETPPPQAEEPPPPPPPQEPAEPPPPSLAEANPSLNLSVDLDVATGAGGAWSGVAAPLLDPAAAVSDGGSFSVSEVEKPPELISAVPPVYPASLRRAGVEGRVVLVFVVDEQGQVQDPRVEQSTRPEFEAPALEAVRKWRFRPAQKDGRPVRAHLRQPIRFSIPR